MRKPRLFERVIIAKQQNPDWKEVIGKHGMIVRLAINNTSPHPSISGCTIYCDQESDILWRYTNETELEGYGIDNLLRLLWLAKGVDFHSKRFFYVHTKNLIREKEVNMPDQVYDLMKTLRRFKCPYSRNGLCMQDPSEVASCDGGLGQSNDGFRWCSGLTPLDLFPYLTKYKLKKEEV